MTERRDIRDAMQEASDEFILRRYDAIKKLYDDYIDNMRDAHERLAPDRAYDPDEWDVNEVDALMDAARYLRTKQNERKEKCDRK